MRTFGVACAGARDAAVLLLLTGCSPTFGRFTDTAYRTDEYPIAVGYAGGSPSTILGKDWIVENFSYVDGSPNRSKGGPRYVVNREYDTDGNGRPDTNADEPLWDLRLEHRQEDAIVWLSTLPLSTKDRDKALSVLARRWLDDMSGAETMLTLDRAAPELVALSERRSAVRSLDSFVCSISGREAWGFDVDLANVDALSVSPGSRSRRSRLIIVRSGYSHHPSGSKGSDDFPVFVIAGYSNAPEAFADRLGDFNQFLSLIALGNDDGSPGRTDTPQTCAVRAPALEPEEPPALRDAAPAQVPAPPRDAAPAPVPIAPAPTPETPG